jgi:hypothetical protein
MYRDDTDRTLFCRRLARTIEKYKWTLVGFLLMPTHFHLIVEVGANMLQPGMRDTFGRMRRNSIGVTVVPAT